MMTNLNMTSTTSLTSTNTPSISTATSPTTPPDELLSQITPPSSLSRHPLSNSEYSPAATETTILFTNEVDHALEDSAVDSKPPPKCQKWPKCSQFKSTESTPSNKGQSSLAPIFFSPSPLSLTPYRIPIPSTHDFEPPPEGGGRDARIKILSLIHISEPTRPY